MNWFDKYSSSFHLTKAERGFLSGYTEEEFLALLPENFILRASKKMTVVDCVKSVIHYYTWGKWIYFGENAHLNDTNEVVRSEFEDWMKREKPDMCLKKGGGMYGDYLTSIYWGIWHSAAEQTRKRHEILG